MQVEVGVSNRHVHLTKDDYQVLFGIKELEVLKPLVQIGQFSSMDKVVLKTEKSTIENVRILGPYRSYTQVEISRTDAYKLGLNPPIRTSGDIEGASLVEIIGPCGSIKKECCIIPNRHIHMTEKDRESLGLLGVEEVSVRFDTEKSVVFDNVKLKVSDDSVLQMHIDTDDANGSMISTGMKGTIIK